MRCVTLVSHITTFRRPFLEFVMRCVTLVGSLLVTLLVTSVVHATTLTSANFSMAYESNRVPRQCMDGHGKRKHKQPHDTG